MDSIHDYMQAAAAELLEARFAAAIRQNPSILKAHLTKYHITWKQVRTLMLAQDFACSICKISLEDNRWVVEHAHKDFHRVRGFTCVSCNAWLGVHEGKIERAFRHLGYENSRCIYPNKEPIP